MNQNSNPGIRKILIFTLDGFVYALPIGNVIRVIHALEIRELPKAPEVISGIINVGGQIIPVVDMRKRFGMAKREIIPDDNFILADTGKRHIALWIDEVTGIKEIEPGKYSETKEALPYVEYIQGVARIEENIILIYDLEQCLNMKEEMELEKALSSNKI
jgi:purine-binding chemotaxis protein CheW